MNVNFYLLSSAGVQARLDFACRLAEKIFKAKNRLFIYTEDAEAAAYMNDRLWSFKDSSFVPHCLQNNASSASQTPIIIGYNLPDNNAYNALMNLALTPPNFAKNFPKTLEIVPKDENWRQQGRQNYRLYQQQGFEITTHNL